MTIHYKKLLSPINVIIVLLTAYILSRSILNPNFFDVENFPLLTSFIVFWVALRIYGMATFKKVNILSDRFQVKDDPLQDIHYANVKGVIFEGDELRILGKEKELRFSSYQMNNFKELKQFFLTDLNFKKIPFYKHLNLQSFIKFIYVAGTLISMTYILFTGSNKLKYYLPLKCIETIEIEGTLNREIHLEERGSRLRKVGLSGVLRLDQYPGYTFRIPREKSLDNAIINLESTPITIHKGASVKVKIRKNIHEKISTSTLEYARNNQLQSVYALEYDGVLLFQKRGLCE